MAIGYTNRLSQICVTKIYLTFGGNVIILKQFFRSENEGDS